MRDFLLPLLVDPVSRKPLALSHVADRSDECINEATLMAPDGREFPVVAGIPRFAVTTDEGQQQVSESFGEKWARRELYDQEPVLSEARRWLLERYGFSSAEELRRFFASHDRILDAGCGSGFSASLWLTPGWRNGSAAEWVGFDISSGIDVAKARLGRLEGTSFVQADMLALPFAPASFDVVFAEGVMHHTPSTQKAFMSLVDVLAPGGEFLFYVYRKKAPIREFADDFVRDYLQDLPPDEAWDALQPLTRLGQSLAEAGIQITVPEDIPFLGIKAGTYDLQRFLYWNFIKMFWNPVFSFASNNHTNFDWYHPRYAYRHTREEIERWCDDAALEIIHLDEQEAGYTVRARKPSAATTATHSA